MTFPAQSALYDDTPGNGPGSTTAYSSQSGGSEPLFPTWVEADAETVSEAVPGTVPETSGLDWHAPVAPLAPMPPAQPSVAQPSVAQPSVAQSSVAQAQRSAPPAPVASALDPRLQAVQRGMQVGAWPQVAEKVRALLVDYPHDAYLESLLEEATLKADLMQQWTGKINGRRLSVRQEWLLRRSLPFFLVLALFLSGALFYQNFVAPSRQVVAMARANQSVVDEATGLLQAGRYEEARPLFADVLGRDPGFEPARQGLDEAKRQMNLAVKYDLALEIAQAGNVARSLTILAGIQRASPAFRDVDAQINRLRSMVQVADLYAQAEEDFAQQRWLDAVAGYEQVMALAADYQSETLTLHLNEAYLYAAQELLARAPMEGAGPQEARTYLRKAQSAGVQPDVTAAALDWLDIYFRGERAVKNDDLLEAVNLWRGIYDTTPTYLGGTLAERLYRLYLTLGDTAAANGSTDYARDLYQMAAGLQVADTGEARLRLDAAPAATPTPTPLLQPVAVYVAPVEPAAPPPTAEPTPTPAPSFQGWIAFRTNRNGGEAIFVMQPDGSNAQPAPETIRSQFDLLYEKEQWSPDGSRHVFVQSEAGRSDANVFVAAADGQGQFSLTNFNEDEYDPAWSPNGQAIAFVSNHTYNDEIWVMAADGSNQRQLTWNEWEWDKHPTWSPDSSQLAFYSNRGGSRQVWVMGSDGSGQRNISSNRYEDWDPVWIK